MTARHPRTGRWLAYDCEIDCQERCAGLCGAGFDAPDPANRWPCNETPATLAPCSPPVQRAHLAIERRHRGSI